MPRDQLQSPRANGSNPGDVKGTVGAFQEEKTPEVVSIRMGNCVFRVLAEELGCLNKVATTLSNVLTPVLERRLHPQSNCKIKL